MSEGPNTPPPGEQPPPPGQQGQTPPPAQQPQQPQAPQAPQPQGQPGGQGSPGPGDPGDLITRFLARVIDGVILAVGMTILTTLSFFLPGGSLVRNAFTAIIWTALALGYYGYMESERGQTVGKMLLKLKVVGPNGGNPTMEQAVKRSFWYAFYLLGIIPFLGNFLAGVGTLAVTIYVAVTINNDAQFRQGFHDTFAGGTRVIKTG